MQYRVENELNTWTVPYLPLDPTDIGRNYDADVIRINSQSGKGGVGYILEHNFGLSLPPKMREHMSYTTKSLSDHQHKELKPEEIFQLYLKTYENKTSPFNIKDAHFKRPSDGRFEATVTTIYNGEEKHTVAEGNGRLDAVTNAVKKATGLNFTISTYQEHALAKSSSSRAIAYVGIDTADGTVFWGSGVNSDIIQASIMALVNAINNSLA
jgi:2-isopropylmalate synthase